VQLSSDTRLRRRTIIRLAGTGAGLTLLAACGPSVSPAPQPVAAPPTPTVGATPTVGVAATTPPTSTAATQSSTTTAAGCTHLGHQREPDARDTATANWRNTRHGHRV
jgi:hypothetical protein